MRLGILGGSFDPIHSGHVELARSAGRLVGLDQVLFMVAQNPPHKQNAVKAGSYHRFAMANLALRHEARLLVSSFELERLGPSYTVDTLETWTRLHPQHEVCFLAGGDSLQQIHFWKDYDKLLSSYSFVFVGRRGMEVELESLQLAAHLKSRIQVCETPQPQLRPGQSHLITTRLPPPASSSTIRSSLARGEDPEFLDSAVLAYLRKHHLYE